MAKMRNPVLAVVGFPAMPRTVVRALVDPVPLSLVSLVWRKGLTHPGLDALRRAAAQLTAEGGRLDGVADGWIPASDLGAISPHKEHMANAGPPSALHSRPGCSVINGALGSDGGPIRT